MRGLTPGDRALRGVWGESGLCFYKTKYIKLLKKYKHGFEREIAAPGRQAATPTVTPRTYFTCSVTRGTGARMHSCKYIIIKPCMQKLACHQFQNPGRRSCRRPAPMVPHGRDAGQPNRKQVVVRAAPGEARIWLFDEGQRARQKTSMAGENRCGRYR